MVLLIHRPFRFVIELIMEENYVSGGSVLYKVNIFNYTTYPHQNLKDYVCSISETKAV